MSKDTMTHNKQAKKRPNECQFCTSRKCNHRITCVEKGYDEVFCYRHSKQGYEASDKILGVGNGVLRTFQESTGDLRRGIKNDQHTR